MLRASRAIDLGTLAPALLLAPHPLDPLPVSSCVHAQELEQLYYDFKASFVTGQPKINRYELDWPGICKPSISRRKARRTGQSRYAHLNSRERRACIGFMRQLNRKKNSYRNCRASEFYPQGAGEGAGIRFPGA